MGKPLVVKQPPLASSPEETPKARRRNVNSDSNIESPARVDAALHAARDTNEGFGSRSFFLLFLGSMLLGGLVVILPFVWSLDCHLLAQGSPTERPLLMWPFSALLSLKCRSLGRTNENVNSTMTADKNDTATAWKGGKLQVLGAGYCIKKSTSTSTHECGEDAFSLGLVEANATGRSFLAVADGVGGWTVNGGDSSKISVGYLEELRTIIKETRLPLREASHLAFARMAAKGTYRGGSTTMCAAVIDQDSGTLNISNVGDSGALVFRKGQLVLKTKAGTEGFNTPYQFGFDQEGRPYGLISLWETRYSLEVMPGDVIVMATDGVLDNLHDEELREMVEIMVGSIAKRPMQGIHPAADELNAVKERIKSAATTLAWHSWARSQEAHWLSPFALSAVMHGFAYAGGKQDDITIIVAVIREAATK